MPPALVFISPFRTKFKKSLYLCIMSTLIVPGTGPIRTKSGNLQVKDPAKSRTIDPASIGLDVSKLPEGYRDMFNNIPSLRFSDTRSGLQKLGDALGITNYLDKLQADAELQARTDYMQMLSLAREEEYNTPLEASRRMREAGLNPDLSGIQNAGEASEYTEPEQRYEYPGATFADIGQFMSSIPSVLSNAVGIASAIQGLKSQGLDIASKEISLATGSLEDAPEWLSKLLGTSDMYDYLKEDPDGMPVFQVSDSTLRKLGVHSRLARRSVQRAISAVNDSPRLRSKFYKTLSEREDAKNEYISKRSQWFVKDDPNDQLAFLSAFETFKHEVELATLNLQKVSAGKDTQYYKSLDPTAKAGAENAQNSYNSEYYDGLNGQSISANQNAAAQYQKEVYAAKQKLIKSLLKSDSDIARIMALQLMGEADVIGNVASPVGKAVGAALK